MPDRDDDDECESSAKKRHSPLSDKIEQVLLDKRRVFLSEDVNSESAKEVVRKLWYLDHIAPGRPILFMINSPGGQVDSGFFILDQINMLSSPVVTLVSGLAASFGSVLSLVAGKGKRLATPNSRIMIHQPLIGGVMRGQATDLEIQATEMMKTRAQLVEMYVQATGRSKAEIEKFIMRDKWLTPQEAIDFGVLDKIVTSMKEVDAYLR
jgi:ATP-dependent Clp protease protease subunit